MAAQEPKASRPWLWPLLIGVLALAIYASTLVEITTGDGRPRGDAASLNALQYRDDVNVLFILIDTLRADRLGSYGYERETSPTLDYMASTGVRFDRHLAQSSWTKCSMASLWTGLNPARTGVLRFDHALPGDARMPAEIFQEAGFRTAGIWRNGWVAPNFGFDQGFEVYGRPARKPMPKGYRRDNPHVTLEGTDHDAVDNAIEFLRVHGQERWFLYMHLMDVHQYLYDEKSALFGSTYSDVYDNSIRHTDDVVGRLLTHLAEEGQLEKTLVVITSDHGEAFSERGHEGHAKNVYRETTEIPFILGFPFQVEGGLAMDFRTSNVDVWPTVLELLGLPGLEDTDGRSLVPELLAAAQGKPVDAQGPVAFSHLDRTWGQQRNPPRPTVAALEDGYRLVYFKEADGRTSSQLFDANADRLERRDVIADHPDVAEALTAEIEDYLEGASPSGWGEGATSVEIDEMELNQLRALGYELP
ncbi:MAG: sulfatase [Myxococcota bacterium]